jgi:sigma-E factor negative regulatory protein RseB
VTAAVLATVRQSLFFKSFWLSAQVIWAGAAIGFIASSAWAQSLPKPEATATGYASPDQRSINEWLVRAHNASKKIAYIGTFVVSSSASMSSAKIWHVCEGDEQIERVENLSGAPRSVFRHNDQVVTFLPDQKLVRTEKRDSLGTFPELLQSTDSRLADFYKLHHEGAERVAGVDADVITLVAKDSLRFGYRIWTEQKRGLVVKLQTLDSAGAVLEQAAFSELQIDAPVKKDKLVQMMGKVDGYRVEKSQLIKTTASAEGWTLRAPVAGFKSLSCFKRPAGTAGMVAGSDALQWVFSDGLASVSIFVETFDRQRHERATQTLTRQLGPYWATFVGEVPPATLRLFADSLERKN